MRSISGVAAGLAVGLALSAGSLLPADGVAQTAAPQSLTPDETEAYQMSLTLAGSCSPQRQGAMTGSQSVIRRPDAPMSGTAAFVRSFEGTFLVLEHYNENLEGHCLVLGWFGGPLEPGRYAIEALATSAVEAEVGTESHSFYSMFAVRSSAESLVVVADSGSVELTTVEADRVVGTFDVSGFVVQRSSRTGASELEGSFTALAPPEG